ncbi:hypothetical protein JKP88DRAFT_276030 [Tribonema minus]|uniref:Uncharacterized protein n=1 Tax=Tribonema minus TaxID=303371 RepID=A0A835Z729_9STRA|nr:hypothetical protein JKP88DRAFT_276030 [Tribonema minus]
MSVIMEYTCLQCLHKMVRLSSTGCQPAMMETFNRARQHMIDMWGPSGAGGLRRQWCHPANLSAMLADRCVLCSKGGRGGVRVLSTWGLYAHQSCADKITRAWTRVKATVRNVITYDLPRQVFATLRWSDRRDDRVLIKPHWLLPTCPSVQDLEAKNHDTIAASTHCDYLTTFHHNRDGLANRTGYASWNALSSAVPLFICKCNTHGPSPDDVQLVHNFVAWSPQVPQPLWKWCFIKEQLHLYPPEEWAALLREAPAGFAVWAGEVEHWSPHANFIQVQR